MTKAKSFVPLPAGSKLTANGSELTLGPSTELAVAGTARDGRATDGRVHRVLEFPPGEVPPALEEAFKAPGVSAPCVRSEDGKRVTLVLRPPPGPSLEWVLGRREGLPLLDVTLVESLSSLFQGIHDAGLLFRSVSPAMFSVAPDGTIQLEHPDVLRKPGDPPSRAATLWCAPEVLAGADGDTRADVWALGALSWSLLTGRIPFERNDFPLPRIFRPLLPHGVATAVSRALQSRPGDRHESCRAFAADLRARTAPKGTSPVSITASASTEIGRLKGQQMSVNQDAFYIGLDPPSRRGMLLIADGVSTADVGSGDLASSMVREAVRSAWEGPVGEILRTHSGTLPEEWAKTALEAVLEDGNARIYAFLKQPIFVGSLGPGTHPPGSTAVLCILDADRLTIANLGDSRFYLMREGALEQMTVDQDLRTELLQAGRDPRIAAEPAALGALTQSVGSFFFDSGGGISTRPLEPDLQTLFLRSGDRVLICTDGVPDCLGEGHEEVIARELREGNDPEAIAKRLCRLADEALGADNITALVLLAS